MSACRSCSAPIVWATTQQGKTIPLDAEPNMRGNVVIFDGTARYAAPHCYPELPRYVPHWATCPNADEHRRSRP